MEKVTVEKLGIKAQSKSDIFNLLSAITNYKNRNVYNRWVIRRIYGSTREN